MRARIAFLKRLKEQAWLVALFSPIVVLVIISLIRWHKDTEAESSHVTSQTEISSAEVSMIVAKPLTELLAMEVYVEAKEENLVTVIDPQKVFGKGYANNIFTTTSRSSSFQQVACLAKSGFAL